MSVLEYGALGVMKAGKVELFDQRAFVLGVRNTFGDGVEIEVVVRELARVRTRAQEKFFHGPVLKAFEPFGYRKQEAKEMLCLKFIPQEIRQLDGSVVLVPGRTSTLTVEEYNNELIEPSIQLAAENGQIVLDGDEWLRQQRKKGRAA